MDQSVGNLCGNLKDGNEKESLPNSRTKEMKMVCLPDAMVGS